MIVLFLWILSFVSVCFIIMDLGFLIKIGVVFVVMEMIDVMELFFGSKLCFVGIVVLLFVEINIVLLWIVSVVFENFL